MEECVKTKYATEKDADFAINKFKKTSKRDTIPSRAYFCFKCNGWHLSSKDSFAATKIKELQDQIRQLQAENKEDQKKAQQKAQHEINVDARVKQMQKLLLDKQKLIKKLREESQALIIQKIQLEKKIEQYENKNN